jgi:hypothetical protein
MKIFVCIDPAPLVAVPCVMRQSADEYSGCNSASVTADPHMAFRKSDSHRWQLEVRLILFISRQKLIRTAAADFPNIWPTSSDSYPAALSIKTAPFWSRSFRTTLASSRRAFT